MTCDSAKEQFADSLMNRVESFDLQTHLRDCSACRDEYAAVRRTWEALALIPAEEPGPAVRERFYQTLDAFQHGVAYRKVSWSERLRGWWPRQPVLQFGVSLAMLAVGIGIGHYGLPGRQQGSDEMAQLKSELSSMRQLVALSLLQQQSANERLKGVTWAYQVERDDTEVLGALLHTVNHDPNVNVRLAAVDALRKFALSPVARKGIAQALPKQSDPLVQVSLLEVLSDVGDKQSASSVQALLAKEDLDSSVRQRASKLLIKFE